MIKRIAALGLMATLAAGAASAASFTYTINNVTFLDGATMTGGFDYDDVSGVFSNVSVTLADASVAASSSGDPFIGLYDFAALQGPAIPLFGRIGGTIGDAALGMVLDQNLSALAGGTANITVIGYGSQVTDTLSDSFFPARQDSATGATLSGVPISAAVPLPAALPILLTALGALGLAGRRRA